MNSTFGSFPTALKIPAHINGVHMLVISVLFESNSSFFFFSSFFPLIICRYSLKPNDQILAEAKHKELLVSPLLQHSL